MNGALRAIAFVGAFVMVILLLAWINADVAAQCRVWRILVERDGLTQETILQRPYGCSPPEEKPR